MEEQRPSLMSERGDNLGPRTWEFVAASAFPFRPWRPQGHIEIQESSWLLVLKVSGLPTFGDQPK